MKNRYMLLVVIISCLHFCCTAMIGSIHKFEVLNPNDFKQEQNEAVFYDSFDNIWTAAVDAVAIYPIVTLNKEAGIIVTDWKAQLPPFIFIIDKGQYASGVFRSEKGGSYSQKRERLNVHLDRESAGVKVSILTSVEVYFDNSLVVLAMGGSVIKEWRPALSDGITESNILKAIRLKIPNTNIMMSKTANEDKITTQANESDLKELVSDENMILLDIHAKLKEKYLLLYQIEDVKFKLNDVYDVCRIDERGITKIGTAKVIQIKENKAALQYTLLENAILSTATDKIQYK